MPCWSYGLTGFAVGSGDRLGGCLSALKLSVPPYFDKQDNPKPNNNIMSGSDASYHDDDDDEADPGGGGSSKINKKKISGIRTTADDVDDDDDEDTNDNDNDEDAHDEDEDEAQAGDDFVMDNNAEEDDDDDDHAEEVATSLSKMTKIVNNLIARADSIPFREPGKTSFFDTTV